MGQTSRIWIPSPLKRPQAKPSDSPNWMGFVMRMRGHADATQTSRTKCEMPTCEKSWLIEVAGQGINQGGEIIENRVGFFCQFCFLEWVDSIKEYA